VTTDREAILDVIARYARVVDDRDVDGIVELFTDDGRIDLEGGVQSGVGHDGIRAVYEAAFRSGLMAESPASTHLMGNTRVSVEDDVAHAETDAVAFLASPTSVVTRGLRYSDDLVRVPTGWRIARRVHRSRWQSEAPGRAH
jgi:ketosteroid isomerase-like protein